MNKEQPLYFTTRTEWRGWLIDNFDKEREAWLLYPKKSTGKARILYNDAVEEALCFGWIDGKVKTLDKDHLMQRFTPRKPGSGYSQPNIERLKWLAKRKMIHPDVQKSVKDIIAGDFEFPADILDTIKKDRIAWENYRKFSDAYKRIRIAYIAGARKRPEEFRKRLSNFIENTGKNRMIRGYGGIEKYY